MELEMKVQPAFLDDECAIVFSFYFSKASRKIGEATIYTYEEKAADQKRVTDIEGYMRGKRKSNGSGKVAYMKEFSICEEYEDISLNKMMHFLEIIGIQTCIVSKKVLNTYTAFQESAHKEQLLTY